MNEACPYHAAANSRLTIRSRFAPVNTRRSSERALAERAEGVE
jgi:hypothetical protein